MCISDKDCAKSEWSIFRSDFVFQSDDQPRPSCSGAGPEMDGTGGLHSTGTGVFTVGKYGVSGVQ